MILAGFFGKPAARLQSKMVCGAHIKTGSQDTFIGGPTERVAFVLDLEEWLHTGLEALGLAALAGGLLLLAIGPSCPPSSVCPSAVA